MRRVFPVLIILVLSALLARADVKAAPRQAAPRTPAEIIALINEYRAENGLPAYQQHSILMGTAQDQSDYQAAIGQVTHEGPGGTRPRDRAYAAGYGNGKIIWISEIIYGYTFAGPDAAVNWWKTSEIHNYTMLAEQYQHIGAGVAVAGNRYYYTAVVGWITIYDNNDPIPTSGPSPTPSNTPLTTSTSATNPTSTPSKTPSPSHTTIPASPSATWTFGPSPTASSTPTPFPEGAIIHIVQTGETLSIIAARYGVALEEILALNNLTLSSLIFPGNQILIQAAPTPSATPTASATATSTTAASATATHTSSPSVTATELPTASPTITAQAKASVDQAVSSSGGSGNAPIPPAGQNQEVRMLIAIALAGIAIVPVAILAYVFKTPGGH